MKMEPHWSDFRKFLLKCKFLTSWVLLRDGKPRTLLSIINWAMKEVEKSRSLDPMSFFQTFYTITP